MHGLATCVLRTPNEPPAAQTRSSAILLPEHCCSPNTLSVHAEFRNERLLYSLLIHRCFRKIQPMLQVLATALATCVLRTPNEPSVAQARSSATLLPERCFSPDTPSVR